MTTNLKVINDFMQGISNKTQHLFSERGFNNTLILYSYGYHFPLCIKLNCNVFLINKNGYSKTTAKHKSLLCKGLGYNNFKELEKNHRSNIKLYSTDELKNIIRLDISTFNEIVEAKI